MHLHASFDLTLLFILIFLFLLARFIWYNPERKAAMKKLLDKAKTGFRNDESSGNQHGSTQDGSEAMQQPTPADVIRYRYHHGTNIGSLFALERWLTPSMFHESAKGSSELAAVKSWVSREGIEQARERFEKHWREYVSDGDLDWLAGTAKCTTVRLPIGYFTLGPSYCDRTPFKDVSAVYQNAWESVKHLVTRCHERGIGVLIDVHGLPGGANAQDHSGTDSGKAELWSSRSNRGLATKSLCFIAQQARSMEGVAGIQIINEAEWDAKGMYEWYENVLSEMSRIDSRLPIYVSDGWNLNRAVSWGQSKNSLQATPCNPVVVDTHYYWCFTDQDKNKSPHEITNEVQSKLSEIDGKDGSVSDRGATQAVVGEYSCVLDERSWSKRRGEASKEQLVRNFGNAESQRFQHRAGGSFFWTYRMDWMPGGEWGFRQMTEQHAITPPESLMLSADEFHNRMTQAQTQKTARKHNTVSSHCQYWDTTYPGHYEHWRFEHGWDLGFHDAMGFFGMRTQQGFRGGDKIGMLELWCLKRLRESGQSGGLVWEFEQGLRQGVRDFYECVGI